MLYNAGITPHDGLLMLLDDERDNDGKIVLQSMIPILEDGKALSEACRESGYFPNYMISMLETGEQTGRITETLQALSQHYERQERIAQSLRNAVLYPALLLALMVSVVALLIVQVLPMFNEVFVRLGTSLPPLAEQLMLFGGWLAASSVIIAIVVGVVLILAFIMWLIPSAREGLSRWFKNTYGNKGLMGRMASSRFASGLALGVASGLEMEKAVELAASISGSSKSAEQKYNKCLESIKQGSTLSEAVFEAGIFSARNTRMLSLGARSGMTDAALSEIAERSGRAVQDEIDRLIGRVEPTIVIISSVITGVILLSVMLPLMGIMTALG